MHNVLSSKYAKYSGLIGVAFEWLALILFFVLEPTYFDGYHPISFFATLPQTRIVFEVCYSVAAVNFWIFFKVHLSKNYQTPLNVLGVSLITFVATALWPYNPVDSLSTTVHIGLFLISSVTFMYGMYIVSGTDTDKSFRYTSTGLAVLSASTFIFYIALTHGGQSAYTLVLESGWWLILQIWIIWISYHSRLMPVILERARSRPL